MSTACLAVADALWVLNNLRPGSTRNTMAWLNLMSVSQSFFSFTLLKFTVEKLVSLSGNSTNPQLAVICCLGQCCYKVSASDTMTWKMVHTE